MFKSQLQEYAQKTGLPAPVYDTKREGPSHEPQFKASVTIQGIAYESPAFFGNLKKAEHAAAEVALIALGKSETGPLHESGLCKNLLQEYAQKSKLPLPVYSVEKTGEILHSPSFIATVEVAGVHYKGQMCKTKKEAEIKAAKNALVAIYADSGASALPAVEDEKPSVQDDTAAVEIIPAAERTPAGERTPAVEVTPAEPKSGGKRKKLFKGGKEVRKQKIEGEKIGKIEESKNGNLLQAGDTKQVNGSSSLPAGSADIGPGQELLGSKAADACIAGILKIATCTNGNEQPVQCPIAQEQSKS